MKIKTYTPYAAVLALALSLSACSSDSAASPTAASETAPIVVDTGTTAATEEATPTEYWSVPLSETYRVDGYARLKDADKYNRNEMIANGDALIRTSFNDLFIIWTNIGYLEDITSETSPFTLVSEAGEDSEAEFGYYIAVLPRNDTTEHLGTDGVLEFSSLDELSTDSDTDYYDFNDYTDFYDVGYTVRLVDIYDNVLNQDWETVYGLTVMSEENTYLGDARVQYLSWHTEGDIPVEDIAYVEFSFVEILNEERTVNHPVLDYYIKVRNPYVKS